MQKKTVCFNDRPSSSLVPNFGSETSKIPDDSCDLDSKAYKLHCNKQTLLREFIDFFRECMFIYETPKVVLIKSAKIGSLFRTFQIGILIYFISWVMIREKGYQKFDYAISGVTTKITGVAWTNIQSPSVKLAAGPRIWDNADYSVTPQQNSGFFVVTRIATLVEQTLGFCAETSLLQDARCNTDADCTKGYSAGTGTPDENFDDDSIDVDLTGHGIFTGKCLSKSKTCEIFAWCPIYDEAVLNKRKPGTKHPLKKLIEPEYPLELDPQYDFFKDLNFIHNRQKMRKQYSDHDDVVEPFYDAVNFTIYIKNSIEFPYFHVKRRNILNWMNQTYLEGCNYEAGHPEDKFCPIFRLGYVIEKSGANVHRLLKFGGVIAITIDWECNLDRSIDYCLPKYDFKQLDSPPEDKSQANQSAPTRPGEGWTVEYAYHYGYDGDNSGGQRRMLSVVNGIQFIVRSTGKAGKFNIINFTMNCGSGMALFGTATLLCDLILFNIARDRHRYRKAVCDTRTVDTKVKKSPKKTDLNEHSNEPNIELNAVEKDTESMLQIKALKLHHRSSDDFRMANTGMRLNQTEHVQQNSSSDYQFQYIADMINRSRLKTDQNDKTRPESTISNKFTDPPLLTKIVPSPRFI